MPDERALPLPIRLLLDAEEAILGAAEAISAPGRNGHIGPLSAPGGVMAHVAWTHDLWSGQFIGGLPIAARQTQPDDTPYREGIDAFRATTERVRPSLLALDAGVFRDAAHLDGTPFANQDFTKGYMARRGVAHLYVHAGDLTVAGSLVGMPDLSLPGPLAPVCRDRRPRRALRCRAGSPRGTHRASGPGGRAPAPAGRPLHRGGRYPPRRASR